MAKGSFYIWPTQGYAVSVGGKIDIRTVSDTKQAAKINALLTVFGTMVSIGDSDTRIEELWEARSHGTAKVVPVKVEAA